MKRVIFVLAFLSMAICSFTEQQTSEGKDIFTLHCKRCHGAEGTRHFLGAKDLQKSILPDSAVVEMISKGKRIMPSFKSTLSREQIEKVVAYVKTLRK